MAIKETPANFRVYYKLFITDNKQKIEDTAKLKETLEEAELLLFRPDSPYKIISIPFVIISDIAFFTAGIRTSIII